MYAIVCQKQPFVKRRFKTTGSVQDIHTKVRERPARSIENIQAVRASMAQNPQMSVERRAKYMGISKTSTWRILKKDLRLHPYKIQLAQELKPADHERRRAFTNYSGKLHKKNCVLPE